MPAIPGEVEEALLEGVKIHFLISPIKVIKEGEKAIGIEYVRRPRVSLMNQEGEDPFP